jgi:hypothetical protein
MRTATAHVAVLRPHRLPHVLDRPQAQKESRPTGQPRHASPLLTFYEMLSPLRSERQVRTRDADTHGAGAPASPCHESAISSLVEPRRVDAEGSGAQVDLTDQVAGQGGGGVTPDVVLECLTEEWRWGCSRSVAAATRLLDRRRQRDHDRVFLGPASAWRRAVKR